MNTLDINSIHEAIVKDHQNLLHKQKDEWELLHDEIKKEKNLSGDVLKDLRNYSNDKKDEQSRYEYYLLASLPILEEFAKSKEKLQKISFFRKNTDQKENTCQVLTDSYIAVVEKNFPERYNYHWKSFNHHHVNEKTKKKKTKSLHSNQTSFCKYCDEKENSFLIADNSIICESCGNVHDMTNDNLISYKDIERINIGSRYSYDRKTHFKECIKKYQGKQNCTIPKEVFENIIIQLKKYNLIPDNYDVDDNQKVYHKINREHILMILKDQGYSKFYEDITYIYHKITKKPIPDVTEYESILLQDFDKLLEVYDNNYKDKNDPRKNFINNNYVLYQLLRRHNYPCEKENFSFLKTNDRKSYHDQICGNLFQMLNWNFRPLF